MIPEFGIHPWYITSDIVQTFDNNFSHSLVDYILCHQRSSIGEIGLDMIRAKRKYENVSLEDQQVILRKQLELGIEHDLTCGIFCVRVSGNGCVYCIFFRLITNFCRSCVI